MAVSNSTDQHADETSLFRKSWSLYDAIVERNYMYHQEIYGCVAARLAARRNDGAYALLDLGCGNARFLSPCLQTAPPSRYEGVDLSAAALDEARDHLRHVANVTLRHEDMLRAVQESKSSFDVIFTGFAVHHLDSTSKQALFHACAHRLTPGGELILVDVVREEGQTRAQYLEKYLAMMRSEWIGLPADQIEEACEHVSAFDFPETLSELTRMAAESSLKDVHLLASHAQHHALSFSA